MRLKLTKAQERVGNSKGGGNEARQFQRTVLAAHVDLFQAGGLRRK